MKNLMVVMSLLLMAQVVGAYEIEGNPDRKISLGFTFERKGIGGDYNFQSFKIPDAGTLTENHFKGDVRIPVSSFLTLSLGGGYSTTSLGLAVINKDERWEMKGYSLTAGFRVYIP